MTLSSNFKRKSVITPVLKNKSYIGNSESTKVSSDQKDAVLNKIHQMRLAIFEDRTKEGAATEKPYLPMLSSDEKELIIEQYYTSKKKLNNAGY